MKMTMRHEYIVNSNVGRGVHVSRTKVVQRQIVSEGSKGRSRACVAHANADAKSTKPNTPLLDTINYPVHMKNLSLVQLKQLAQEVQYISKLHNVSHNGIGSKSHKSIFSFY